MQGTENATMLLGCVLLSLLFLIGGTIKLLGPMPHGARITVRTANLSAADPAGADFRCYIDPGARRERHRRCDCRAAMKRP